MQTKKIFTAVKADNFSTKKIFLSVALASFLAIMGVSMFKMPDFTTGMLASVSHANVTSPEVYESDVFFEKKDNSYILKAGKNMQKVDVIEGVLLLQGVSHGSAPVIAGADIMLLESGLYRFSLSLKGIDFNAGDILSVLELPQDSKFLKAFDMQFVSGGNRYNLTNMVE